MSSARRRCCNNNNSNNNNGEKVIRELIKTMEMEELKTFLIRFTLTLW